MSAQSFIDIFKYNDKHDELGRFASKNGGGAASGAIFDENGEFDPFATLMAAADAEQLASAPAEEAQPKQMPESKITEAAMKKCNEVEQASVNLKKEQMTVIDKDGNIVIQKEGAQDGVEFTPGELHKMENRVITHNHPQEYGGTFSLNDINTFCGSNAKAIRIAAKEGTYHLETGEATHKQKMTFKKQAKEKYDSIMGDLAQSKRQLDADVKSGKLKAEAADNMLKDWRKDSMKSLSEAYESAALENGMIYTFTPSKGIAKSFDEILKFNPHHDSKGRFTSGGAGSGNAMGGLVKQSADVTAGYTGSWHGSALNDLLRNHPESWLDENHKEVLETMDNAMQETTSDMKLIRGVSHGFMSQLGLTDDDGRRMSFEDLQEYAIGREYTEKGYSSCTYAEKQVYGSIQLNINVKAGTKALWPDNDDEKEIILGRNQTFKITDCRRENHTIVFDVDTVPNKGNVKKSEEENTFSIYKTDEDKRLIFGWASVAIRIGGEQVVDLQKDLIDPEDLEAAVYDYVLDFRDSGEEHIADLRKKGRLVESVVFTKEKMKAMGIPEGTVPEGWWIGFYIDDDEAWEKVKNGTYKMFSIEGQGVREKVEEA